MSGGENGPFPGAEVLNMHRESKSGWDDFSRIPTLTPPHFQATNQKVFGLILLTIGF